MLAIPITKPITLSPIHLRLRSNALTAPPNAKPARIQSGSDNSECWLTKNKIAESTTISRHSLPIRHRRALPPASFEMPSVRTRWKSFLEPRCTVVPGSATAGRVTMK
jgi:hypothetical protein